MRNSGIGSNGLTLARHALLAHSYAERFPESFSETIPAHKVYCGAFQLNNLKDGASYSFAVQGATVATCSFTAYSDVGVTSLTMHLPPDHTTTIASKHTLYTFMVMGTHVYASWVPGY